MRPRRTIAPLLAAAVALASGPGCWVSTSELDDKINGTGPDSSPGPVDCERVEQLADGGFEEGSPSVAWDEYSVLFGTPICNETCDETGLATPFEGRYWVWLGGASTYDEAGVSQRVVFGGQGVATLSLMLSIPVGSNDPADKLTVLVDGETMFEIIGAEGASYAEYAPVEIDVGQYADGQPHEVEIRGVVQGNGVTNFFVDAVSLMGCP